MLGGTLASESVRRVFASGVVLSAFAASATARAQSAPTAAQPVTQQPTQEQVPAAWVNLPDDEKRWSALLDVRSFYDFTTGRGPPRPNWMGGEILSYFDLSDGFSGAFIYRHEVRDQIADYGTIMIIPRIAPEKYLVSSIGIGSGADFLPVTRLDIQLRAFFKAERLRHVMYDVGGYGTWWTQGRRQMEQSNALIWWNNPWIVEARETVTMTSPGFGAWRPNWNVSATALYGEDRKSWLVMRAGVGTEPENVPGLAFADTRDLPIVFASVGYRRWLTRDYGISGEVEGYHQLYTWSRLGVITSLFASF